MLNIVNLCELEKLHKDNPDEIFIVIDPSENFRYSFKSKALIKSNVEVNTSKRGIIELNIRFTIDTSNN